MALAAWPLDPQLSDRLRDPLDLASGLVALAALLALAGDPTRMKNLELNPELRLATHLETRLMETRLDAACLRLRRQMAVNPLRAERPQTRR